MDTALRPQPKSKRIVTKFLKICFRVDVDDLNTTMNPGATCFAEAAYISPHEYTWCQAHPGSVTCLTISPTVSSLLVTSDFTRRLRNLAGQTTAHSIIRVTAACLGLSLRSPVVNNGWVVVKCGTVKRLRRIRTGTRSASAHCITSGLTPIDLRHFGMRRSASSRQGRPSLL